MLSYDSISTTLSAIAYTNWLIVPIIILKSILLLWLPGLIILSFTKMSRFNKFAYSPLVSVAIVGGVPIVLAELGVPFTKLSFCISYVVIFLIFILLKYLVSLMRSEKDAVSSSDYKEICEGRKTLKTLITSLIICLPFSVAAFVVGVKNPQDPPQTWDTMFHLSAIRWILNTKNGSALNLNNVASNAIETQNQAFAYYPSAFHDFCALVYTKDIVTTANSVSLTFTSFIWVVGAGILAYKLFSDKSSVLFLAPIVATAFTSFPEKNASLGTLWPIVFSYALIPYVLAVAVELFGKSKNKPFMPSQLILLISGTLSVGLAHPQGVFAFVYAVTILWILSLVSIFRKKLILDKINKIVFCILSVGIVGFYLVMVYFNVYFKLSSWAQANSTRSKVLIETLGIFFDNQVNTFGPDAYKPKIALGIFVIGGIILLLKQRKQAWLLLSVLVYSYLYLTTSLGALPGRFLSSVWYYDALRVGAILPIYLFIFATYFSAEIYEKLKQYLKAKQRMPKNNIIVPAVCMLVFLIATQGLYIKSSAKWYKNGYIYRNENGYSSVASEAELSMIRGLRLKLSPNHMIIGDMRIGLPLVYSVGNYPVVFRHLTGKWDDDYIYLAHHLNSYDTDPKVCKLLEKHKIKYVYTDKYVYRLNAGLDDIASGMSIDKNKLNTMKLVASGGSAKIYEITSCP